MSVKSSPRAGLKKSSIELSQHAATEPSTSTLGLSEGVERFLTSRIKSIRSSLTLRGERVKEKLDEDLSLTSSSATPSEGATSSTSTTTTEEMGAQNQAMNRERLLSMLGDNVSRRSSEFLYPMSGEKRFERKMYHEKSARYLDDLPRLNDWLEQFEKKTQYNLMAKLVYGFATLYHGLSYILPPYYKIDEARYVLWMVLVNICFLYNMFTIFIRVSFRHVLATQRQLNIWFGLDYFTDLIFLLDIFVHLKLRYLHNGLYITDPKLMRLNYIKQFKFKADLIAILPTDLLYFIYGIWPIFRINRIFKYPVLPQMFDILEIILKSTYIIRMAKIVLYLLLLINIKACCFYAISEYEGFGINDWVYDGQGNAYLRCFYFGLKTSTSIGNNEGANNNLERIYMTVIWLIGTFSVALFFAQVRAIFEDSRQNISEFRTVLDKTMNFLTNSNVSSHLIERTRKWIIYTWKSQKCLDESEFLDFLSLKMQTDIAISVHFETLSKVKLFQDCERNLLRDLVLQLKPCLYLPGDYVCKKGEIGREMYIINSGIVQVTLGKEPNLTVLATLKEGSVFGEISLLAITGENRRTANVRSKGFSSLFVLSKENLDVALKEYPEAKVLLEKRAKKILKAQKKKTQAQKMEQKDETSKDLMDMKESEVKVVASPQPKMIDTVLQIMDPHSKVVNQLKRSAEHSGMDHLYAPTHPKPSEHEKLHKRPSLKSLRYKRYRRFSAILEDLTDKTMFGAHDISFKHHGRVGHSKKQGSSPLARKRLVSQSMRHFSKDYLQIPKFGLPSITTSSTSAEHTKKKICTPENNENALSKKRYRRRRHRPANKNEEIKPRAYHYSIRYHDDDDIGESKSSDEKWYMRGNNLKRRYNSINPIIHHPQIVISHGDEEILSSLSNISATQLNQGNNNKIESEKRYDRTTNKKTTNKKDNFLVKNAHDIISLSSIDSNSWSNLVGNLGRRIGTKSITPSGSSIPQFASCLDLKSAPIGSAINNEGSVDTSSQDSSESHYLSIH